MSMLEHVFSSLHRGIAGLSATFCAIGAFSTHAQFLDESERSGLFANDEAQAEPEFSVSLMLEPINPTTALAWLTFESPEDWHTYGPYQNDSGALPIVGWTLPEDVQPQANATDWVWPIPKRHLAPGEVLDYVYYGNISAASRLTGPENWWQNALVSLEVEWLVCDAESCVPQFATVDTFTIADSQWKPSGRFLQTETDAVRSPSMQRSLTNPSKLLQIETSWDGDTLTISSTEPGAIEFYPMLGGAALVDPAQTGTSNNGRLLLRFDFSETPRARGVVAVVRSTTASDDQKRAEDIPAPVFIDLKKGASLANPRPE